MPSVRVRRAGGRPYTVMDSPDNRDAALRPTSPNSARPASATPSQRISLTEEAMHQSSTAQGRRRRGTVTSFFNRNSSPTPSHPYAADEKDQRASVVADSVLKPNRQAVRNRANDPTSLLQPGSPGRDRRRSFGNDVPSVDVRLSRDDLEGQVGSALSLPEEESEDDYDYDEHHHDEIVDHLDVIDPQVATMTHLSNTANSIFLPPLSIYSRRPVMTLPNVSDDAPGEKSKYTDELDRHVDHVLKRRDKVRRVLKGTWAFVKTPVGFCTALYAFLCGFWGAAIVIFLAKIINLHNPDLQNFWIEVSSQVTNGLFTATGVGLIPWRVIDTYRMAKITHYKRLTRRLRAERGLPALVDEDDLPDPMYDPDYVHVLTDQQQDELHYQQQKFMQSQTWYRPHATETHRAFSINTALIICVLIDFNSIFQIILCGVMWGLNRFQRPAWTTGTLIPASFLCAIGAAVFIGHGGAQTKKTKQVEDKMREALQLEKEGLMNAHLEEREGFTVVEMESERAPPPDAETLVIPLTKAQTESSSPENQKDLEAVPSGPASRANTTQAKESKKAPILP